MKSGILLVVLLVGLMLCIPAFAWDFPAIDAASSDDTIEGDWVNRGYDFFALGMYDESIRACDKALRQDPNDVEAWRFKGNVLIYRGKYDEALLALDKAIEKDPEYTLAWINKGHVLNIMGKYNESIKALEKAMELDPQISPPWDWAGISGALCGQDKYNRVINQNLKLSWFWYYKGYVIEQMGAEPCMTYSSIEAIKAFDEAIGLNPNFALAWYDKGNAFFSIYMYNEALQDINEAIEINPKYAEAWRNKGVALEFSNQSSESDAAFAKARELGYKD